MYTVPNQRVVKVHREKPTSDFLGIKNENWQTAARDLGAHALLLYMYLASNMDGYNLALSPAAIRQSIGMPPQTYRDQFNKLLDKGYILYEKGNIYNFYERPQHVTRSENFAASAVDDYAYVGGNKTSDVQATTPIVKNETADIREINKEIMLIKSINNTDNFQKESKENHINEWRF